MNMNSKNELNPFQIESVKTHIKSNFPSLIDIKIINTPGSECDHLIISKLLHKGYTLYFASYFIIDIDLKGDKNTIFWFLESNLEHFDSLYTQSTTNIDYSNQIKTFLENQTKYKYQFINKSNKVVINSIIEDITHDIYKKSNCLLKSLDIINDLDINMTYNNYLNNYQNDKFNILNKQP